MTNVIKTDYWDIDAMADAIYSIITYPAIYKQLREEGEREVNEIKWKYAGQKVIDIYHKVMHNITNEKTRPYMKTICFYFQIHQPFRLKRYRFFDIGNDHYYYDDFANDDIITRIAQRSYLPANATLLEMIKNANGKFKVAFSISGVAWSNSKFVCLNLSTA